MTVSTTATKVTTQGNGATTVWPFTFAVQDDDEIVVTLTESDGTVTVLSSSVYSVTITAPTGTNPTSVGGSVTYPLSGTPAATGDFITVQRLADYLQETSLANQGISWQSTIEGALDYQCMLIQQLSFQLGQQFSVPVSDDPPATLPVASERADLWAYFDSDGNLTAAAAPDGAVAISAAMIPVVGAATLTLARGELGLGNIAVETIGAGLTDFSGVLRVVMTPVADSTNKAVAVGFHQTDRHATGALTYTAQAISTLFAGFGFYVSALTDSVTFAINVADSFSGGSAGASLIIPPGTQVYISTDGTNTWFVRNIQALGLDSPLNLQLNASVAGSALTVEVKDRNGNNPSTASPVLLAFRDATATNGNPVIRVLTSALSIVVPDTALLGTASAIPFRVWIGIFDNAGTQVLGVFQSVVGGATPTAIVGIDESASTSGIAISTGSDSGGVWYTASTVTTMAFRILGYIDFSSGQATAGTWATTPDKKQLFGPAIKLPGDEVQRASTQTGSVANGTTIVPYDDTIPQITEGNQYMTQAITPKFAASLLEIEVLAALDISALNNATTLALFRDTTAGALAANGVSPRAINVPIVVPINHLAQALATTATTFRVRAGSDQAGTTTFNGAGSAQRYGGVGNSFIKIKEIMT